MVERGRGHLQRGQGAEAQLVVIQHQIPTYRERLERLRQRELKLIETQLQSPTHRDRPERLRQHTQVAIVQVPAITRSVMVQRQPVLQLLLGGICIGLEHLSKTPHDPLEDVVLCSQMSERRLRVMCASEQRTNGRVWPQNHRARIIECAPS